MLKLLKWVYQLARQTERQRIEHILINNQRFHQPNDIARELFGGKDYDDLPPKKQQNVQFEKAVNYRVNQIIDDIVRPNDIERESYSILYPKERK